MELALAAATALEYGVLILLFGLSIWSISIMIDRRRTLRNEGVSAELEQLRSSLVQQDRVAAEKWAASHPGVHAKTLKAAIRATQTSTQNSLSIAVPQLIDREVRSLLTEERLRLEKGLPVLATLGANAPFVGLFGTVLGIIRAFAALGESSGAANSVMSGISQALIATAAGLFVAIPAVVAFNVFSSRIREILAQCEALRDLFVAHQAIRISDSSGLKATERN